MHVASFFEEKVAGSGLRGDWSLVTLDQVIAQPHEPAGKNLIYAAERVAFLKAIQFINKSVSHRTS